MVCHTVSPFLGIGMGYYYSRFFLEDVEEEEDDEDDAEDGCGICFPFFDGFAGDAAEDPEEDAFFPFVSALFMHCETCSSMETDNLALF